MSGIPEIADIPDTRITISYIQNQHGEHILKVERNTPFLLDVATVLFLAMNKDELFASAVRIAVNLMDSEDGKRLMQLDGL